MAERFDITAPRWDQSTFMGRLRHFANITDPRVSFCTTSELMASKKLFDEYKRRKEPSGTTMEELYRAQKLVGSAFHPDTGELQNFAGRMCFNAWGGTMLCGAMMVWYQSTKAVLFWQFANQSFNAVVNYTNRNANSELTNKDIGTAYFSAVTGALVCATGLKKYFEKRQVSTMFQRMVPLGAVAVANAINIPLMRQNELRQGISVTDERGMLVGESRLAAYQAISQVVLSRNVIVAPCMILTPITEDRLKNWQWYARNFRTLNVPVSMLLTFVIYGSMVPVGCALFPQKSSMDVETLKKWEPEAYEKLVKKDIKKVYFNKGL